MIPRERAASAADYAGRVSLYRLADLPPLTAPVLIAAFDGWIDAAGASSAAADHLAANGAQAATFDGDVLYDYRARRPVLDIVDGTLTQVSWPELLLRRSRLGERDVLVLSGPEPDYRWRELADAVAEIAARVGVTEWVSLGAIPAAVPHTRPVPILATASRPGLLPEGLQQGPQGLLRVPSAALSVLELTVTGGGVPAVGLYAQVPHYVGGPYPAATVALLENLERHLGVPVPLGSLPEAAATQRATLDQAVAEDEDATAYLARLESLLGDERIPSGEEIASEIERFLRESGPGSASGQTSFDQP
jgi:hypothetical protein